MTEARVHRQFGSTEHLASEAIAAYVDGELRMQAYLRAAQHIAECGECSAAVEAQQQARGALRGSGEMTMPLSLLGLLSQIPSCNGPHGDADRQSLSAPGRRFSLRRRK
ncbi:hypothetical protein ABH922_000971 [Rhodococcus sp. 27YEA15]|uniref:hypothetical protein n=1 Tax=Rhodococcus sp. 27YEA15 TaxID=3156259 RepID=UPI003C79E14D